MPNEPHEHVRVRRLADRARYERQEVEDILHEGTIAHVGTVQEGHPIVIPMFYAVDGGHLLLHGAPASGVLRRAKDPVEICATVTLLDGWVLARSAFHHSMNYRSVVVIGSAEIVDAPTEKAHALGLFAEKLVPGRQAELRPMSDKEIRATSVMRLSLEKSSAKVRVGPPVDDEEDYAFDVWAGVIPTAVALGDPIADPRLDPSIRVPDSIRVLYGN